MYPDIVGNNLGDKDRPAFHQIQIGWRANGLGFDGFDTNKMVQGGPLAIISGVTTPLIGL